MYVMFSISTHGQDAAEAEKLKEQFEALLKQYGLEGTTQGKAMEQFASFSGTYKK